jgi:TonB-linked SusC/RagA family outer membrane protein
MRPNSLKKRWFFVLALLIAGYSLFAQQITGVITDEQGQPLPGVNIVIKGTTAGTVTDVDGRYAITVPDRKSVIVISYIGYLQEEITAGDQTEINITLVPELTSLDEVVVIGYGTVKKRDLTGSVASVSARQIKDIPVSSAAQAITGRLAGVQITTTEGSPDAEVKIRVRGGGSITQDNSPLYIVDGFPVDGISDIAPSDIESIDVLKDASSTAIYGARGANGVIIVTTRGGRSGKTEISYNFYYGMKKLANKLDVLSPYEFVLYQYERSRSSFQERNRFENMYGTYELLDTLYMNSGGTDWQDEVFGRKATTTYHNISITGGQKDFNYNLSFTRNDDEGIMVESGFVRNNLNFKFQSQATSKLRVNFDARYSDLDVQGAGTSDPGTSGANRLKHSVIYRPVNGLYDFVEDPDLYFDDEEYYNTSGLTDPLQLAKDEYRNKHTIITSFNGSLTYSLLKGLDLRTDFGYNSQQVRDDRFYGLTTYTARRYADRPVVNISEDKRNIFRWTNTINYRKENIFGNNNINLLLGQELINTNKNEYEQETRLYPKEISADLALGMTALGEDPQSPESKLSEDKLLSYFGRILYDYNDKYLATFTLRADGSSKFWKSNHWGLFPSGSVAWRISQEEFMQDLPFISLLKARLSYGEAGNNRIDDYLFLKRFATSSSKPYFLNEQQTAYLYQPELPNPDLRWETTVTRNAGVDFGLFNNRLSGSIDYYYNSTRDLLVDSRLDPSSGYESQMQNIGQTSNRGLEMVLDAYIIEKPDFNLSVNFNIAFNKSRVDKLSEYDLREEQSEWNNDIGTDYIVRVGDPVGLMYGFITDGFYTVDDFDYDEVTQTYTLKDGVADNERLLNSTLGPGTIKFRNLAGPIDEDGNPVDDGNQVTNEDDRTVIGNANPKHIGGFNIMMAYKGIDLSLFVNWVYGNDIYNANKIEFTSGYKAYTNMLGIMNSENRWMTINEQGEVVNDPVKLAALNENATIWKPPTGNYLFHSWAVEDGSFLRINNVTLGYTLPESLLSKVLIRKFRIYATANNLHTFTRYSGYDPEVNTRRDTPMTPGVDYSAYPRSRMIILGLNLTF